MRITPIPNALGYDWESDANSGLTLITLDRTTVPNNTPRSLVRRATTVTAGPVYNGSINYATIGNQTVYVICTTRCAEVSGFAQFSIRTYSAKTQLTPKKGKSSDTYVDFELLEYDSGTPIKDQSGATVELLDARGTTWAKGVIDPRGKCRLTFAAPLKESVYTLQIMGLQGDTLLADWVVADDDNAKMALSPNPAIAGLDQQLRGFVYGIPDSLAPFMVEVTNASGSIVYQGQSGSIFSIPVANFSPGTYQVSVTGSNGSVWRDSVDILFKGVPRLNAHPVPFTTTLSGQLQDPIPGREDLFIKLIDTQGMVRYQGNGQAAGFQIPATNFPKGFYQLSANDGLRSYSLLVEK